MPRRLQFLLGNCEVKCLQDKSSIAFSDDNQMCCRWLGTFPCTYVRLQFWYNTCCACMFTNGCDDPAHEHVFALPPLIMHGLHSLLAGL